MKTLFYKNGKYARLVDKEKLIFEIDNIYYNQHGEKIAEKKESDESFVDDGEAWNAQLIEDFLMKIQEFLNI